MDARIDRLRSLIKDVPGFPKPEIVFKDITPLLGDARGLATAIELLAEPYRGRVTAVVGMESRGFIFGAPVACALGVGFVPVRKPGKLPRATVSAEYSLEYGTDCLEMHEDAVGRDDRVLVVDDLLATGGTAEAAVRLVHSRGAQIVGASFVIELEFLCGREKLQGLEVRALLQY
ncbi:MAG: adenine phosphoribosyltransferase [Myxococcota bacterium]|jgi:adenine phosphoribosyltransferase|nr:adenine phosphoribosyltransferase [Myxococcota bacterium]